MARFYGCGDFTFSRNLTEDEISGSNQSNFFTKPNAIELDYDEYFVDEIENLMESIKSICESYNVTCDGAFTYEYNGERGAYIFEKTAYNDFWGEAYYIHDTSDDTLIKELTRRGYTITT